MDKLSKIISNKFKKGELNVSLKAAWICSEINKKIQADYFAKSFNKGVLVLAANSYPEAAMIKMQKSKLITTFNKWLLTQDIKDLKIVIKSS